MSPRHPPPVVTTGGDRLNGPPSLSADGRFIAWLSSGDIAPRLTVLDVERRGEPACVDLTIPRVRAFTWSHLPDVGIAVADATGGENWRLYRVGAGSGDWAPLGGPLDAQMRIAGLGSRRPEEVLVAATGERSTYSVVSLRTGEQTTVLEDSGHSAVYFDQDFRPRLVETVLGDGSREIRHGDAYGGGLFLRIPHEAAMCARFLHFSADGSVAYFVLPRGPAESRLVGLCCADGEPAREVECVFSVNRAGIVRVLAAPATGRPQLVEVNRFRPRTVAVDPSLGPSLSALRRRLAGEPTLLERRPGDGPWLVARNEPQADAHYFVYEPSRDELWPVSAARPARKGQKRPPVACQVADVPVRDGQRVITYVTRATAGPEATDGGPAPAVLLVHGGPWRRTGWEYAHRRAWLAARGFTVIEPNFRGSTGLGAAWVNAGDGQWGAAMQDDLEDVLDWAVRRGHADPARIALVGGSYGGYAVLQLAATTARELRCVIALSPVTDLVAFVEELPPYWRTAAPMVRRRVGDAADPEQRRRLVATSPLHRAAGVRCPVLMVHGMHDTRVPVRMSSRMFMAFAHCDADATLALFPDEGHEIVGAGNRSACDALMAGFLDRCLRGEEPTEPAVEATSMKLMHTPRRAAAEARPTTGVPNC